MFFIRTPIKAVTLCILLLALWALCMLKEPSSVYSLMNKAPMGCNLYGKSFAVNYQYFVHDEEKNTPIAYGLTVYTDLDRTIRLLRAIHRPQNVYCVHVDKKTKPEYVCDLRNATNCIGDNIFFVPDNSRLDVRWGTSTNLLPELLCAELLLKRNKSWKYFINLTGQEFPLKTNWEIVTALAALNGTNLVESSIKGRNIWRIPPANYTSFNVTYFKGPIHVALRREFVKFMLYDKKAKELLSALMRYERFSRRGIHMDETFFATLNRNPKVFPALGASLEARDTYVVGFVREKSWCTTNAPCKTKIYKRCICMYGLLDLPFLMNSSNFFANKFDVSVQPETYKLLESWLSSKMLHEKIYHSLHPSFNRNTYAKSRIVWNHL